MQGPLAWTNDALCADLAVKLVFDLQQAGAELAILVALANTDRFVRRIRFRERLEQRFAIVVEIVIADGKLGLSIALVAESAHPQRRGIRQIVSAGGQITQFMRAPVEEAPAYRRRGANQIEQQPGVASEIAYQRKVGLVRLSQLCKLPAVVGERKIVMDA